MKFKVGDKVKLVRGDYYDSRHNPFWGRRYGKTEGNIYEIHGSGYIRVRWDNGESNVYHEHDLEFLVRIKKQIKVYGIVNFIKKNYK